MRRRWCAALLLLVALFACGEPPVDVSIPQRDPGQHVVDLAGILDAPALEERLAQAAGDGMDIVALTYETEQAGCGEAYRAAREFVAAWDAEVAVVAVAQPGDFTASEDGRERCLGVQPLDDRAIPGAVRERIAEELVPQQTVDNDWDAAFAIAVETLVDQ